jgi:hypothetical protein
VPFRYWVALLPVVFGSTCSTLESGDLARKQICIWVTYPTNQEIQGTTIRTRQQAPCWRLARSGQRLPPHRPSSDWAGPSERCGTWSARCCSLPPATPWARRRGREAAGRALLSFSPQLLSFVSLQPTSH